MPAKIFENCETCRLRPALCHGVHNGFGLTGCNAFDHRLCKEWGWTCVCNPRLLEERIREVIHFRAELERNIPYSASHLPHYIPTVYHRYGRQYRSNLPYVALPLHTLFDITSEGFIPKATSAEDLRQLLGVQAATKIIITGPGPDESIEQFWRYHKKFKLLNLFAVLRIEAFTVANYSFPQDCPPLHYRFNRGRILRLAERAVEAGINPILHLNALHENDWKDWENLLKKHTEITAICLEFQTGYSKRAVGALAIERLIKLQDNIGRRIHPVIIGGSRFIAELGRKFANCTFIDAEPFLKTYFRKMCVVDAHGRITWDFRRSERGEFLDRRFNMNVQTYSQRLYERFTGLGEEQLKFRLPFASYGPLKAPCKQISLDNLPLFCHTINAEKDACIPTISKESRIPQRETLRFPNRKRGSTISHHKEMGSHPPQLMS